MQEFVFYAWNVVKTPVNKDRCACTCWDALFKGPYQHDKFKTYKDVYFNLTSTTLKIWAVTIAAILLVYECLRWLIKIYFQGRLRNSMALLVAASLYPHYYGWWMIFNYLNDKIFRQFYHQIFFSLTELLSTFMIVHLCNKNNTITPRKMQLIISVAVTHIVISGGDQFVSNVLKGKGMQFQIFRDFGFMLPDILNVVIPAFELRYYAQEQLMTFKECLMTKDSVFCTFAVLCMVVISWHL